MNRENHPSVRVISFVSEEHAEVERTLKMPFWRCHFVKSRYGRETNEREKATGNLKSQ
jgi:hypothetical protein